MKRSPVGVVLTGGASRRMGSDKAFVVLAGRPMVVVVADALWEAGCHPVECQGGDLERLAGLGLPAIADSEAGRGPVAAIADALARHDRPILVAACDLGHLDAETVRSVIDGGVDGGRVAVATSGGHRHLLSYWTPDVGARLAGLGTASYREALDAVDALAVPVDDAAVRNINRSDDL